MDKYKIKNTSLEKILKTYKDVVYLMPGHVYWKDCDGVFLGCNLQQALDAGLSDPEQIVGKTDADMPWRAQASYLHEIDKKVMSSGKALILEEIFEYVPGQTDRIYLSNKIPLYDDEDKVCGILGISFDITDRKKLEQDLLEAKEAAEAANTVKTEFIQNMQHDIRTPAAGVWSVLDILSKRDRDAQEKEILTMATKSSKQLLDLCNDMVELGHLERGEEQPVTEKKVDIRALVQDVLDLNKPAAFSQDLILKIKVKKSVPPHIKTDEYRLRRILINLLGNAIKFTDKGSITLSIDFTIKEGRRGLLCITVGDTGIGIEEKNLVKIFGKFSRLIPSNTGKYPGTGLGLYMVRKYVDDLEGDLDVKSVYGEGTLFKVYIKAIVPWTDVDEPGMVINEEYRSPLTDYVEEKTVVSLSKDNVKETKKDKTFQHRLLLIEDDSVCLFAEKQIVSAFTPHIDMAKNMREALELLQHNHYDLVISDLGLPDGSGAEIAAIVRASVGSPNQKTPFVAMTAHRDKEKHQEALNAGFTETATKPLTEEKAEQFLGTYPAAGKEASDEEDLSDLDVIDLELTIKRLHAKDVKSAVIGLGLLSDSLKEDIPALQKAQKQNDILGVREVLHKVRGGLYYSGTPCLEKTIVDLHAAVKLVKNLKDIEKKFDLVYEQADIFEEYYQALIKE